MSNSLRDQLLGLGFKAPPPEPRKPRPEGKGGEGKRPDGKRPDGKRPDAAAGRARPAQDKRADGRRPARDDGGRRRDGVRKTGTGAAPRSQEEIDLAKAYAIRAQKEKEERLAAERQRQEEARQRREAKAKLATLVQGRALNDAAADIARHFPYGGKIKRIHVTAAQLKALNAGELGVLQLDGRYLLVDAALLAEAEAIFPPAIALKVDPSAPAEDDPYADPKYQVPDDLVW
ncbi:DUF2058 domain-containing protein [Arenimonas composti]|uniref:Nucleoprotein/polynucleotide-associated enzyme n=1 Tax=Arenimonas composti TR7-09 = DSM 18010 TaxID=1121013 RepID=A0A091BGL0_9GAMM|nr:DUF2058 family protein [Arenimonas composti]KFN50886.1 hypothetical protein P873_00630 [Arenimonas composti TR7-09 = DSM 18010]